MLSARARVFLWLVLAAAVMVVAALSAAVWRSPSPLGPAVADSGDLLVLAELVALVIVAQHFPLTVGPQRKLDLSFGLHFTTLLLAGAPLAVLLVGIGEAAGQATLMLRHDRETGKRLRGLYGVLFNTSQFILAVAVAGLAERVAPPPLGVPAAAAALFIANTALVAVMAGLHQGRNPLRVWLGGRRWSALQAAGILVLGFATARSAAHQPWVPLLMVIPAALTYASLRRTAAAEAALTARDEFLSLASHELRTPLTSLRGYAQLLLMQHERQALQQQAMLSTGQASAAAPQPVTPQMQRALQVIDRQSTRLCGLIEQLLDISRVQAGKLTLSRDTVDLADVARDVAAALQPVTPQYRLVVRAQPGVYSHADRLRLEQVLTNLVTNAAKYAGGGDRIEVQVGASGRWAQLAVRDYGVGIDPAHRARIFDRYYQAPHQRPVGGLGVGLFISREIVERHGGTIAVESPPGGGARFVVSLPREDVEAAPASALQPAPAQLGRPSAA